MKLNSSLLAVFLAASVCSGEVRVRFSPEATPEPCAFSKSTPYIGKVLWDGSSNPGYIIEETTLMQDSAWNTFSVDSGAGNPTRHSVVLEGTRFYQVLSAPAFAVGQQVYWQASLSNVPTGTSEQQYGALWIFADGSTQSVTGLEWTNPLVKVYDYPGLKTATVIVSHPNGLRSTNTWAVSITNSLINLVTNGNLELQNGSSPAGWYKGGTGSNSRSYIYPVPGFNGSQRAAQLIISNFVSGDGKWYPTNIMVQSGGKYHLDLWFFSTASMNVTVQYTSTNGVISYQHVTTESASPSWNRVERDIYPPAGTASFTVFPALTSNGSLVIDDVSVVRIPILAPLPEAMFSFDIDDGNRDTALTTSAILQSAGYRGTYYIVTPRVGLGGIVTTNDLHNLRNSGHEIGAHTLRHEDLTLLNMESKEHEINLSRRDLLSWGLGPISTFAYPFGSYNAEVIQLVREAGFTSASSTDGGFNQRGENSFALKRTSITSNMDFAYIKSLIDSAISQRLYFKMAFHHVDSTVTQYSITPALFQQIVDYLKAQNAEVVTASEGNRILSY